MYFIAERQILVIYRHYRNVHSINTDNQKFIKMYANVSTALETGRSLMAYIYLNITFHVRLVLNFRNRASTFQTSHIIIIVSSYIAHISFV